MEAEQRFNLSTAKRFWQRWWWAPTHQPEALIFASEEPRRRRFRQIRAKRGQRRFWHQAARTVVRWPRSARRASKPKTHQPDRKNVQPLPLRRHAKSRPEERNSPDRTHQRPLWIQHPKQHQWRLANQPKAPDSPEEKPG